MSVLRPSIFLLFLPLLLVGQSDNTFERYFIDRTMRIDYFHIGDKSTELITIDQIYNQGIWAGSQKNLLDQFNNGKYYIRVFDEQSNKLIYSKGFNSYFGEYQTTGQAAQGLKRTFHESALIPFPKNKIRFKLFSRDGQNQLNLKFEQIIDPDDVAIIKENPASDIEVFNLKINGNPHKKVDMAILAEGYTLKDRAKLRKDFEYFTNVFFEEEPYRSLSSRFNIYGVFKPSFESGCDEPTHGVFKNTSINSTFNSMGSPRYLLTEDNKSMRDIASVVPYDAILIMVNQKRYGGGGIYNFFLTFTSDNDWKDYVFIHEFGHSFAGLADEYYSSATAYDEFYPAGIEPVEPNITALSDPQNLKWASVMDNNLSIPSEWNKAEYDREDQAYQSKRQELNNKIASLKRNGASKDIIEQAENEAAAHSKKSAAKLDQILRKNINWDKVGAFEGAGYMSEGLYRPMLDCIMFSKGKKPFCKVCEQAIVKIINFYSE